MVKRARNAPQSGLARRIWNREEGQALIELAFVLPLLMVLLIVVLDVGIAVDRRGTLAQAMREAGRAGIQGATPAQVVTAAETNSDGLLTAGNPTDVVVCYVNNGGSAYPGETGDTVRVSFDYEYELSIGGELVAATGASWPTFSMTPQNEGQLLKDVTGAVAC
jgi:Flp pilus assembly protein TadG